MFRIGNNADFERMVDEILDQASAASNKAAQRIQTAFAAKGGMLNGRMHFAIEEEITPTYSDAIHKSMRLIVQFSEVTQVPIPELCEVAKPKFTAFTSAIMKPIETAVTMVFSAPVQREKQIADVRGRFERHVDDALQNVQVGFIDCQAVKTLSNLFKEGGLDQREVDEANNAVLGVVRDTPKTEAAALKLKSVLRKLSGSAYEMAVKVITDIASETAKKTIGL